MAQKTLFLVCNAHLDPVWLWQWEEGLAETLSTFRTAARFCQEFEDFAFCHNESILYQWIEAYEPELFERIRTLVEQGRWHVVGGWYLQPDCNMPAGESFVRQILLGREYFRERLDTEPTTAVNFDPFGHSRGLVQILKKAGYDSYLFCRPDSKHLELPGDDFVWVGYDGSEILAHRAPGHYNSQRGKAGEKIEQWIESNTQRQTGLLLWGIGNHGGGPSQEDLTQIEELRAHQRQWKVEHGRPEDYFQALTQSKESPPRLEADLNPWAVGCYTSMALVKQRYRLLENTYFSTEKMLTNAALQGLIDYPQQELRQALEDLLFCQFHDVLPGSAIPEVEAYALQRMDHGLEILSRQRARAFFAMLSGHPPAAEGEYPIFAYNPHPYDVEGPVVCEFEPPEPNFDREVFLLPEITDESGATVPLQLEKESSNILVDHRKRVVFNAKLRAASMNRFSCRLSEVEPPAAHLDETAPGAAAPGFRLTSDTCETVINRESGLMDSYRVNGIEYLQADAFQPLVIKDNPDPWGMKVRAFREVEGAFTLMSKEESAAFAGVSLPGLEPVRIIEDGPIRTTVEALFRYNRSQLCLRYRIPKKGSEIEIEVRAYWMEKDRMLKLSIPTPFGKGMCRGQVAYGVEEYSRHGEELVAQKWIGVASADGRHGLTVINDCIYGFDFTGGEVRLSLLRSPAYSGHPVDDDVTIVRQDRFEPRIDQGERAFRFWINAGDAEERFANVDREALVKNELPLVLCCYPPASGERPLPGISLSDPVIQLAAVKMAEKSNWLILRLFEPTGNERKTRVTIPVLDVEYEASLRAFEIKSLAVDMQSKEIFEVDLLERKLS